MEDSQGFCLCRQTNQYGVPVGTTSVRILGPNPKRRGLLFSPTSLNRCFIAFGQAAAVDSGYGIYPGEPPPFMSWQDVGMSLTGDIFAIFETTGETLAFMELLT